MGHDVMFVDGEDTTMITKDRDELFHTVQQRDLPNEQVNVVVQVSGLANYAWNAQGRIGAGGGMEAEKDNFRAGDPQ